MGLFDQIGDAFESAVDSVSDAVSKYQKNRRANRDQRYDYRKDKQQARLDSKELKYEAQVAKTMLKQQGKTFSGIATGDTAYSSAADTMIGFGSAAEPIAAAVGEVLSEYFNFKGIVGAAGSAAEAAKGVMGAGADALAGAGAPNNTVSTPVGSIQLSTAALVAVGAVAILAFTSEK